MSELAKMTPREVARALRACYPVRTRTGYGGFSDRCREHGVLMTGIDQDCSTAEKMLSEIFEEIRREGAVAALLREARVIDQCAPTEAEAELAENLRESAAQLADGSRPVPQWTDADLETARRSGLRRGWGEGVKAALDRAVRNDDGITLRLDEKNPY